MAGKKKKNPRLFSQYKDKLDYNQIAEGARLAQENAMRLLDDAKALLQIGRFPSAGVLAILAIEEQGKLSILDRMAYTEDSEVSSLWSEYRNHARKNIRWILPALADSGPRSIEEFASIFHPDSPFPGFLDEIKQLSLYTDCVDEGKWSKPEEHMTAEFARGLIDIASRLIGKKRQPFKPEEIELRAKHRKVDRDASAEDRKGAIAAYLREARERGFTSIDEASLRQFLEGKIDLRGVGGN